MPHAFEFNEELLLFILEHVQSGWFGDFMFNCERERRDFKATHGCISMWAVVLHNMDRFRNDYNYVPQVGAIMPVARLGRLVLWEKWFNRWHDRLWRAAWIQQCHVEDFDDEDGAALNGGANGARNHSPLSIDATTVAVAGTYFVRSVRARIAPLSASAHTVQFVYARTVLTSLIKESRTSPSLFNMKQ
jgi:hypothetical protein